MQSNNDRSKSGMLSLEHELAGESQDDIELRAFNEESRNLEANYEAIDQAYMDTRKSMPYPNVGTYTTFSYMDDSIEDISYMKYKNKPILEEMREIDRYRNLSRLYRGHLKLRTGTESFIMESSTVPTRSFGSLFLVNVDDKAYQHIFRSWRFPSNDSEVEFSRDVYIVDRKVSGVDILLDNSSSDYADFTDAYLRKALRRNKNKKGMQSIMKSIQRKQDDIRAMPEDTTLIVQGCAGSGKTMVLLHRLRYLLYNRLISPAEYLFLMPSYTFKDFLADITTDFGISFSNQYPFIAYYKKLSGAKERDFNVGEDTEELLLEPEMLSGLYSEGFIKDAYQYVLTEANSQIESFSRACIEAAEKFPSIEVDKLNTSIKNIEDSALGKLKENNIKKFIDEYNLNVDTLDNLPSLIKKMSDDVAWYGNLESLFKAADSYKGQLKDERKRMEKQNFIQRMTSESKIREIEQLLDDTYQNILKSGESKNIDALLRSDRPENDTKIIIDSLSRMIRSLRRTYDTALSSIEILKGQLADIDGHVRKKYSRELSCLKNYLEYAESFESKSVCCIASLEPISTQGGEIIKLFAEHLGKKWAEVCEEKYFLATEKKKLSNAIFERCETLSKEKYKKKINKKYKSYWYLKAYSSYLDESNFKQDHRKYLFIDESQDLSISEIDFIRKVNATDGEINAKNYPVMNVFGDVNQVISKHGITEWTSINLDCEVYQLYENFRNTNQIIEYCNRNLPFNMTPVGVDLDEVKLYKSIGDALGSHRFEEKFLFIVKSDKIGQKLKSVIANIPYEIDYSIYTVKESKGLEFRKVFVLDYDMTVNERYIAFTRALVQLIVIEVEDFSINKTEKIIDIRREDEYNFHEHNDAVFESEIEDLRLYFLNRGFEVIDKRGDGGVLWVLGNEIELQEILKEVQEKYGETGRFTSSSRVTNYKRAWYTSSSK